jgi:hypothetical protein
VRGNVKNNSKNLQFFSFSGVGKFQAISEPDPILAQEQVTFFPFHIMKIKAEISKLS